VFCKSLWYYLTGNQKPTPRGGPPGQRNADEAFDRVANIKKLGLYVKSWHGSKDYDALYSRAESFLEEMEHSSQDTFGKTPNDVLEVLYDSIRLHSTTASKAICEMESVTGDDMTDDFPDPISIESRVMIEFMLFFIHLFNRIAVSTIDQKKLFSIIGNLVDKAILTIPAVSQQGSIIRSEIKNGKWYFVQFLVRQDEYSQYEKMMSEDFTEPTAFKRFEENISRVMGGDEAHSADSLSCQAYVVASLKDMDFKRFIESIR